MEKLNIRSMIYKYLWIICFLLGTVGFIYIFFFNEHTWEINSILEYLFRILIFMILSLGIAFFPNKFKHKYLLLVMSIIFFAGGIIQKMDYIGFKQLMAGIDTGKEYYIMLYLILYPFVVSCLAFGYRIGGGTSGNCIKISIVGVLVLFSNFVDVAHNFLNPIVVPEIIDYNFYFRSWFGRFPTFTEEIIFCISHIPLIVGVLFLPLDKWINKRFKIDEANASLKAVS